MKLVIISTCAPADILLIRELGRTQELLKIIRPSWHDNPEPEIRVSLKRIMAKFSVPKIRNRLQNLFNRSHDHYLDSMISKSLFSLEEEPSIDCKQIPSRLINSPQSAQFIESLNPDILVTCGAPILHETIYSIPKFGTINIHYGIAPQYRGENTLFWALYYRDYDHIGVTLHFIDIGVDTGRILARGYPDIGPSDSEASLYVKCTWLAADLMNQCLTAAEQGGIKGIQQESKGCLYLKHHRTMGCSIKLFFRHNILRQHPPLREGRVETYFSGNLFN